MSIAVIVAFIRLCLWLWTALDALLPYDAAMQRSALKTLVNPSSIARGGAFLWPTHDSCNLV